MDKQKLMRTPDNKLLETFPGYTREVLRRMKGMPAKILVFDIETSQMNVKTWQLYGNEYIEPTRIIDDWFVICWSAKWLFDKSIKNSTVKPDEARERDDERVVRELWELLNEADIVVGQNIKKFDIKKMNTRFIKYGLSKPNYYKVIDTLQIAKKEFKFSANKLDYLCQYLGIDNKLDTGGIKLWDESEKGDKKALDMMAKYCNHDVKISEELYLTLRPYMDNHPNLELYTDGKVCPNCASDQFTESGTYKTQKKIYTSYRCDKCKALFHWKKKK